MVGTGFLLLSICTCLLHYCSVHFQSGMKTHRIVLHIFNNKSANDYILSINCIIYIISKCVKHNLQHEGAIDDDEYNNNNNNDMHHTTFVYDLELVGLNRKGFDNFLKQEAFQCLNVREKKKSPL